jgi:hypothetical protein
MYDMMRSEIDNDFCKSIVANRDDSFMIAAPDGHQMPQSSNTKIREDTDLSGNECRSRRG